MKTWTKTKTQNLVRHKNGGYYARLFNAGKENWRSLKTKHEQVAKARLSALLGTHNEQRAKNKALRAGNMTLADAAALFLTAVAERTTIKPSSKVYAEEVVAAILTSWTGETDMRRITLADCKKWAVAFGKKYSPTRFNSGVSYLRKIFKIAIDQGLRYDNPALELERASIRATQLELPSRDQFLAMVLAIKNAGGRFSKDCADYVQFLAYTGCRKGEAENVTWQDIDFNKARIRVKGDPIHGTKNRKTRYIPLIPEAGKLLQRMRAERMEDTPEIPVLRVQEAQKALDRAAKHVGAARITHHDLRHLFATTCIESGVDIPTVSRWLGHLDGGALAMRTYGHLRDDHSQREAQRVSFELKPTEKIIPIADSQAA